MWHIILCIFERIYTKDRGIENGFIKNYIMPKLQLKKFKAWKRTSEKFEEKAMKASISYVLSKNKV